MMRKWAHRHQRSHCQGLLDSSHQDEHSDVVLEDDAGGDEILDVARHHQGRDWNCSHGQLHAERSRVQHSLMMAAVVGLEPGATAPRDDAYARGAVASADDKLGAVALATLAMA
eukprot:6600880-Pyramimonas_sp.AAC.1